MRISSRVVSRSAIALGTVGLVAAASFAFNPFASAATFTNVSSQSAPVSESSAPIADWSAPIADWSAPTVVDDYSQGFNDGYSAGYTDGYSDATGYGEGADVYVPTAEEAAFSTAWEVIDAQISGDRDYAEATVRAYATPEFAEAFVASPEFNLITGGEVETQYFYLDAPSINGSDATFLVHRVRFDDSENLYRLTINLETGLVVGSDWIGVGAF